MSAISSNPVRSCTENGRIASACCRAVASGSMVWIAARESCKPNMMSPASVVGSPGAVDLGRRELALHLAQRPAEQPSLGVWQPVELLGEGEVVAALRELVEPEHRPRRRRDRARRRWSTPAGRCRAAPARQSRRQAAVPPGPRSRRHRRHVAAANRHGDGAEDQRRHDHRYDDPRPRAPSVGPRQRQPRSSAPSLAAAAVAPSRTFATSASVRLRSAACRRRR